MYEKKKKLLMLWKERKEKENKDGQKLIVNLMSPKHVITELQNFNQLFK